MANLTTQIASNAPPFFERKKNRTEKMHFTNLLPLIALCTRFSLVIAAPGSSHDPKQITIPSPPEPGPDWSPHISADDDDENTAITNLDRLPPALSAIGPADDPIPFASLTFNFSITVLGLGVPVPLAYAFPRAVQRERAELTLESRTKNRFMFRGWRIVYENFVVSYDSDQSVYPPPSVLLPATQKRAIPLVAVPRRYNGRNEYFLESRDGSM